MRQQKLQQKIFGKSKTDLIPLDSSLGYQKRSYDNFLNKELQKIFSSIFPITDYQAAKFKLEFVSLSIKDTKYSLQESTRRMADYAASFFVTLKFTNLATGQKSTDEINFGEIPIMTPNNTFVINGKERTLFRDIKGKNKEEVQNIIKTQYPWIKNHEINIFPFWNKKVSSNRNSFRLEK